jgi:hypothetical protein
MPCPYITAPDACSHHFGGSVRCLWVRQTQWERSIKCSIPCQAVVYVGLRCIVPDLSRKNVKKQRFHVADSLLAPKHSTMPADWHTLDRS